MSSQIKHPFRPKRLRRGLLAAGATVAAAPILLGVLVPPPAPQVWTLPSGTTLSDFREAPDGPCRLPPKTPPPETSIPAEQVGPHSHESVPRRVVHAAPTDDLFVRLARNLSAAQTWLGFEDSGRGLNAEELKQLRSVYGETIDYSRVTVKEDGGLFTLSGRAAAIADTIYAPPAYDPDESGPLVLSSANLIHEGGHIHQYQVSEGPAYLREAATAQVTEGSQIYDFATPILAGAAWADLSPERQAKFLEQAERAGAIANPASCFVHQGVDFTDYLHGALAEVRGVPPPDDEEGKKQDALYALRTRRLEDEDMGGGTGLLRPSTSSG